MGRYSRDQRQCKLTATKEIEIKYSKKVQLLQDWLGTTTWPPFYFFSNSI